MTLLSHVLLFTGLWWSSPEASHPNTENALLKDARSYYINGDYPEAKKKYEELIRLNPESVDYNFEMGLTIWQSEIEREKSIAYFDKAQTLDKKMLIPEISYYSAMAYHFSGNYEKAEELFLLFRPMIHPETGKELLAEIDRRIEMCRNGKKGIPVTNFEVVNLGEHINTSFSEYAPVLKKDGSTLLFTARKRGSTGGKKSGDARYYEDIYVAVKRENQWLNTIKIDSLFDYTKEAFNAGGHNAAVAYNAAETRLYVYKDGDIYESVYENSKWSKPVKMNDNLNTREQEPSIFISPNEDFLIIVSTRKGGYGGRDLYISRKLPDGNWAEAHNMGTKINTPYDDDAPYLSADGKTLYFSSKGHSSIGGYDVFKSELNEENDEWSEPIGLGQPVNSPADDIFYVPLENETAFFASNRLNGYGGMDIYAVQPLVSQVQLMEIALDEDGGQNGREKVMDSIMVAEPELDITGKPLTNFIFHPSVIKQNYQQQFGYNRTELNEENEEYLGFLNQISSIINQKGNVEIIIESSASHVPTTSFGSNRKLAESRAEEARKKIEKALVGAGFTNEKFKFSISASVQGPAYKNDYDSNPELYSPYQYVKLAVR